MTRRGYRASSAASRARRWTPSIITGNTDDTVSRLGSLAEAGVQRVMLQYMETDDIDTLEEISRSVLPQLR